MPSFFRRIRFRNFYRRRVALICLVVGILTARFFQQSDTPQPTQLPVQIATFPKSFHDWSYRFDPTDGRELSVYDRGGHVDECSWHADPEFDQCLKRRVQHREEARQFIYDHWQSRTRAYISIDRPCFDCSPTDHIFIEPDEAGQWHILIVLEESRFPPRHSSASEVVCRRATKDERSEENVSRLLSFRDPSGREVDTF